MDTAAFIVPLQLTMNQIIVHILKCFCIEYCTNKKKKSYSLSMRKVTISKDRQRV